MLLLDGEQIDLKSISRELKAKLYKIFLRDEKIMHLISKLPQRIVEEEIELEDHDEKEDIETGQMENLPPSKSHQGSMILLPSIHSSNDVEKPDDDKNQSLTHFSGVRDSRVISASMVSKPDFLKDFAI